LLPVRRWDVDEFEHLQLAWMISQGMLPYKEFFEHHTPLLHFLVAPWFAIFTDAHDLVYVVPVLFRVFSTVFSLATVGVVWLLADLIAGRCAALLAAVALLGDSLFLAKGIEFRPDPLAVLTMMASAYALVRAVNGRSGRWASRGWLATAGFALAAAVLSTQKVLFAGPGFLVAFALVMIPRFGIAGAVYGAGWASLGAIVAMAPMFLFFAAHGALSDFFYSNFILNAGWPRVGYEFLETRIREFLASDPVFAALAASGALLMLKHWRAGNQEVAIILLPLVSLAVGVVIVPVPQEQYMFLMIPFAAVPAGIAAAGLIRVATRYFAADVGAGAILAVLFGVAAFNLNGALHRPDVSGFRRKLEYIVTQTPPDATIMGGFSTGVAYRKPAFFYWILHPEIREQLSASVWQSMAADLRNGSARPEIVDLDAEIAQLPPDILAYLRSAYAPAGIGTLWRRRP
jgi:hypothetical protein